ncbi:hypothetical protein AU210_008045 [Fusarium oxysporum f. sp. radicis-cucumerinum]|uniref:Uncharacterized protein n=1 Tax=Fusarium oxysporum f. sp. radicis-cucumerinum TaxID=327505 RepID=A0A2H3GYB1_FUSOX|nr:hypothetical protein AU210_008045 [Fusarium oxysporum f. sp. radicis-cucumerinum]
MIGSTFRNVARQRAVPFRAISSLSSNPKIKVVKNPKSPFTNYLSYLEKEPPDERLAIGTTSELPPTPQSFTENKNFVKILNEVITEYGHEDEDLVNQARAFASPGGFNLGSGGAFFSQKRPNRGGAGGGGRGGYVHLSDRRNPPDFGRIAWPEDILGSVEVDGAGTIIGKVQPSGTYRILTNEGILGLSPFLQTKLVERLKQEEAKQNPTS